MCEQQNNREIISVSISARPEDKKGSREATKFFSKLQTLSEILISLFGTELTPWKSPLKIELISTIWIQEI